MGRRAIICILALWLLASPTSRGQAQLPATVTDAAVTAKIDRLTRALLASQARNGSWHYGEYEVGATALAILALRQAGLPRDHRSIRRAVAFIVENSDQKVYSEALVPCALELVDPVLYKQRIRIAARFLARAQTNQGRWSYTADRPGGDNSNSQFAVLGLAAAQRCGVPIPDQVKRRAVKHWRETQNDDGGWGYRGKTKSTLAMTCAGVASLHLLGVELTSKRRCCDDYSYDRNMRRGVGWLVSSLRGGAKFANRQHPQYALYALERVAIFLNVKEFGGVDWYRWGAGYLVGRATANNDVPALALSLLFLAKGSAPIAIAKWQWHGDWNRNRHEVRNWANYSGAELGRRLDWLPAKIEKLDSPAAKASILFVSGREEFNATAAELRFVRSFLEGGGTLVAEGVCDSRKFVDSFRRVMLARLYPDLRAQFEPIDSDHPITFAKHKILPRDVQGYQLKCVCQDFRVILLTRNISCGLSGVADSRHDAPRALKVGTNLLAWALKGKDADKKLDDAKLAAVADGETLTMDQLKRIGAQKTRQFVQPFARLKHRGEWLVAPGFFRNLRKSMAKRPGLPRFDGEVFVSPKSDDLFQAAVLYMAGHRAPALTEEEWLNLRGYLQNGGFMVVNAVCSSTEFDRDFRQLVRRMLPNDELEEIPPDDPIWRTPFDCTRAPVAATRAYRQKFGEAWGPLLGVRRQGRWVLVYSPVDFSMDLATSIHDSIPGYKKEAGAKLVANILNQAFALAEDAAE